MVCLNYPKGGFFLRGDVVSATSGYQASLDSVALFTDLGREAIEIEGSRAFDVLNGLVTNAIDSVLTGHGCYAFLLDPKGRPVVDLRVLAAPGFEEAANCDLTSNTQVFWLDVPVDGLDAIHAHFAKYVPPLFARYSSPRLHIVNLLGPRAVECLGSVLSALKLTPKIDLAELPELGITTLPLQGLIVRREQIEGGGLDLYIPHQEFELFLSALEGGVRKLGGAVGEPSEWDIIRVERGLPIYGRELTPDRLVQEAKQDDRAISFEKGCFTGQEVVARIHYRGHVNRVLRGLQIPPDSGDLDAGDTLVRNGRTVGSVHSVVSSPRFGRLALAYIRREVEPGECVAAADGAIPNIEITALPFT